MTTYCYMNLIAGIGHIAAFLILECDVNHHNVMSVLS